MRHDSTGRIQSARAQRIEPAGRFLRAKTQQPAALADSTESDTSLEPLSLAERLQIREEFFQQVRVDPRQFLQGFDQVPGLDYFVKDAHGRTMLNTRKNAPSSGFGSEEQYVARRASEYLARSLAEPYEADDRQVLRTGQPLRNIIEIRLDQLGVPDWIITDKYPIRDAEGNVVGILGTMQSFEGRIKSLPHLGDVGVAADYIRENLGRRMPLHDVAAHVGISERHLQRLFRQAIGMSIQQFIIHSRVHTAAHQLTGTSRPLAEIALDCGFSDQSAFTNTFRKIFGHSPRDYRKRFLENFTP